MPQDNKELGSTTHLRVTISSGEGENRLRQSVIYMLPKFGMQEPTLDALLECVQKLDGWVKKYASHRHDWIVMRFEYLNHFHPCEECDEESDG